MNVLRNIGYQAESSACLLLGISCLVLRAGSSRVSIHVLGIADFISRSLIHIVVRSNVSFIFFVSFSLLRLLLSSSSPSLFFVSFPPLLKRRPGIVVALVFFFAEVFVAVRL